MFLATVTFYVPGVAKAPTGGERHGIGLVFVPSTVPLFFNRKLSTTLQTEDPLSSSTVSPTT